MDVKGGFMVKVERRSTVEGIAKVELHSFSTAEVF
jgi:hypothetical protein